MAEVITIARPYAKAVFEIARETDKNEMWSLFLKTFSFIVQNESVKTLLRDSTIPTSKIRDFFWSITSKELIEPARNLIALLANRRRLPILPEIYKVFEQLRQEANNIVEVQFKTPIAINETEKAVFQKILGNILSRSVIMQYEVDKELLGGFHARAGNTVIDGSIRGFLTQMKASMGG